MADLAFIPALAATPARWVDVATGQTVATPIGNTRDYQGVLRTPAGDPVVLPAAASAAAASQPTAKATGKARSGVQGGKNNFPKFLLFAAVIAAVVVLLVWGSQSGNWLYNLNAVLGGQKTTVIAPLAAPASPPVIAAVPSVPAAPPVPPVEIPTTSPVAPSEDPATNNEGYCNMRYGFGSVVAASCLAVLTSIIGQSPADAGAVPQQPTYNGPAVPDAQCTIPGSVYVAQIGRCVLSVTDPVTIQKTNPDIGNDPKCAGKPVGFTYQFTVPAQNGKPSGIATQTCGVRPRG